MTVAMARDNKGADFGDDDESQLVPVSDGIVDQRSEILTRLGVNLGDRIVADRHGLLVFPTLPPGRCIHIQAGGVVTSMSIGQFVDGPLETARAASYLPFDARQSLAYGLVHSALSDRNPETRYIQLVTAIEALLPERKRPDPILRALSVLEEVVERWPDGLDPAHPRGGALRRVWRCVQSIVAGGPDEDVIDAWPDDDTKERMGQILRQSRNESVRRIGIDFVSQLPGTYVNETPKKFFDECYGKRSALVHGSAERPDVSETQTLLRFVLDVLDLYASQRTAAAPTNG
jgi:hypothetical protein